MKRERKKVKGNTSIFIKIRTIVSQSCDKNYFLLTNKDATLIFPMSYSCLFLKSRTPTTSPKTKGVMKVVVKVEGVNPCASQQGSHLPAGFGKTMKLVVFTQSLVGIRSNYKDQCALLSAPFSVNQLARASQRVAWICKQAELCIPSQQCRASLAKLPYTVFLWRSAWLLQELSIACFHEH